MDEEPRGGFEGGAEVLEEGNFGFGGADFLVEVVLRVVVVVEGRWSFDGGACVVLQDPQCCAWRFHGGGGGGGAEEG